jgi:hypothetical protein
MSSEAADGIKSFSAAGVITVGANMNVSPKTDN